MRVGVLDFDQCLGTAPRTFLAKEDADALVHQMIAERLSAKVIRIFSPDSPFRLLRSTNSYLPPKLPPIELPGLKLEIPKNCEGVSMAGVCAGWRWMKSDFPEPKYSA